MERNEVSAVTESIAELYDAIYHLTRVVKDLTRVIQEHDKTMEDLVSKTAWLAANMEA